ncbi:hypothetical protein FIV00_20285 [Labrenzia sp. THAF82]|nr:hypothetical protein FIV00_20285 [Labrenzia sp. THAF82]
MTIAFVRKSKCICSREIVLRVSALGPKIALRQVRNFNCLNVAASDPVKHKGPLAAKSRSGL